MKDFLKTNEKILKTILTIAKLKVSIEKGSNENVKDTERLSMQKLASPYLHSIVTNIIFTTIGTGCYFISNNIPQNTNVKSMYKNLSSETNLNSILTNLIDGDCGLKNMNVIEWLKNAPALHYDTQLQPNLKFTDVLLGFCLSSIPAVQNVFVSKLCNEKFTKENKISFIDMFLRILNENIWSDIGVNDNTFLKNILGASEDFKYKDVNVNDYQCDITNFMLYDWDDELNLESPFHNNFTKGNFNLDEYISLHYDTNIKSISDYIK